MELGKIIRRMSLPVVSKGTCGIDFYVGDKYPSWGSSLLVSGLVRLEIQSP
jgi:hypothetical protein